MTVDLSNYDNRGYYPGRGTFVRALWYFCNAFLFASWLLPLSGPKRWLLRLFGASVGKGLVIKPRVNIKYPWRLRVGDQCWIGEGRGWTILSRGSLAATCASRRGRTF